MIKFQRKELNMKLEDFKQIIDEVKYHTNQVALGEWDRKCHYINN